MTSTSTAHPHAARVLIRLGCAAGGAPYIYPYNPPNFNAILLYGDPGKTHYNSMQIKAETKTPRYGLYALLAYTYSRTYDNGLSDGPGFGAERSLLPAAKLAKPRLVAGADQSKSQLHRERDLRFADRARQAVWRQLE